MENYVFWHLVRSDREKTLTIVIHKNRKNIAEILGKVFLEQIDRWPE